MSEVIPKLNIKYLGQSGFMMDCDNIFFLLDPYLSNSVEILDSADLVRKVPLYLEPKDIKNLNYILITHAHIDHCDPHTIPFLSEKFPNCEFIAPEPVRKILINWGISSKRIINASTSKLKIKDNLFIQSVPAFHPKLTKGNDGEPNEIGWIIYHYDRKIYFAGDTSVHIDLINFLKNLKPIEYAFLPVNEDNFFRRRRGIIGNMSIRDAFCLADELEIKHLFPVHWDMFEVNSTTYEEIDAVYNNYFWKFKLIKEIYDI